MKKKKEPSGLGRDSATIALLLVGLGATADVAWNFAEKVEQYLKDRPYDDVLDLETLRKIMAELPPPHASEHPL